jgi:hypothetical protein
MNACGFIQLKPSFGNLALFDEGVGMGNQSISKIIKIPSSTSAGN